MPKNDLDTSNNETSERRRKMSFLNRALPGIATGLIIGFIVVFIEISFAAFIFSGQLTPFVTEGISFMLLGAFVIGIMLAATSAFPGTIALPQDAPVAIIAVMAAAIAVRMPDSAPSESLLITVLTAIVIASLLTGAAFWIMGKCNLGSLIRFIPYPVVGGFLAGTGWIVMVGSLGIMADFSITLSSFPDLFDTGSMVKWASGVAFAILLFTVLRRNSNFLIMPGMIAMGIGLFYTVLLSTHTSIAEAGNQGLLLEAFESGPMWKSLSLSHIHMVNWPLILEQTGNIATIVLMSLISLLLNTGAIELAAHREIDMNRELKSAGIANIVAGLGGSPPGYHALSVSVLGHKLAPDNRLVSLVSALVCGATVFYGAAMLSFFPKPVLAGLLFFLGLSFFIEWVYDAFFTLPKMDYLVILVVAAVVGSVGFLEGVIVGIVISSFLFVVDFSRCNVVNGGCTETEAPIAEIKEGSEYTADQGLVMALQGFIFFGNAHNLLNRCRQRTKVEDAYPLRYLMLDFHRVAGIDASAVNVLCKIKQFAASRNIIIALSDLTPALHRQLGVGGFLGGNDAFIQTFETSTEGIEWCRRQIAIETQQRHRNAQRTSHQKSIKKEKGSDAIGLSIGRVLNVFNRKRSQHAEAL